MCTHVVGLYAYASTYVYVRIVNSSRFYSCYDTRRRQSEFFRSTAAYLGQPCNRPFSANVVVGFLRVATNRLVPAPLVQRGTNTATFFSLFPTSRDATSFSPCFATLARKACRVQLLPEIQIDRFSSFAYFGYRR